jgi:hypothetical protein
MINFNVLVNALIIIILLHLIIVNLDTTKSTKYMLEHYDNKNIKSESFIKSEEKKRNVVKNEKNKDIMNYLENLDEENDETFVTKKISNENVEKKNMNQQINTITPANNFDKMDYLNVPNFESNVLDFNQFYKINDPQTDKNQLVQKNINTPRNSVPVSPRPFSQYDNGKVASRPSRQLPDRWEYANELPMNGGMFGSIVGLESCYGKESLYSSYQGGSVNMKKCAQEVIAKIPHNDLRKPIVYN